MRRSSPLAAVGVLALTLGLTPVLGSPAAAADTPAQLDITPNWRAVPRIDSLGSFGATGFVHSPEDAEDGFGQEFQWTRFDTGETTLLGYGNNEDAAFGEFGAESDYVAHHHLGWIDIRNMADGGTHKLAVPGDDLFQGLVGSTVAMKDYTSGELSTVDGWYLLPAGNPVADAKVPVTGWPEGADLKYARLVAGDADEAVVRFAMSSEAAESGRFDRLGLIDLKTGQLRSFAADTTWDTPVVIAGDDIAWVGTDRVAHLRSRVDLDAPDRGFPFPADLDRTRIGLLDGWLLAFTQADGTDAALKRSLVAVSVGQERRTLLEKADKEAVQIAGGGVAVIGGTSSADWHLQKVTVEGGQPKLEKLRRVAPVAVGIDAIALSAGTLSTVEKDGPQGAGFYHRTLSPAQAPATVSDPAWVGRESGRSYDYTVCGQSLCTQLFNSGDGRSVYQVRNYQSNPQVEIVGRRGPQQADRALTGDFDGRLTDSFGRYAVYQSGRPTVAGMLVPDGRTIVVDLDTGAVVDQRAQTGATVWGSTLYTGTATAGTVARTDLATGKAAGTVDTGAPCVPVELQSAGPWLYWTCDQFRQHGVVNVTTGAKIALPAGRGGLLGDGYFVNQRYTGSNLRLTEFQNGSTAVTRDLGIPISTDGSTNRRATWTVDRFGGGIAYVDKENQVHVVPSGVPASPLTVASASTPTAFKASDTWKASWQLSKPAASWKLTVKSATGATVRTLGGGEARGLVTAAWDGKDTAGAYAPNGSYTWTLTAQPADGQGTPLTATGKTALTGGAAVRHDHVGGDGIGDLLTLNSSGGLTFQQGTGKGTFSGKVTGSGWATSVQAVPVGDLSGDRCNDVLVRFSSGTVRLYRPACNAALTPSTPYTTISTGTGWNQYDVLTSPGDVNKDGRPDLIARTASTGAVYLYKGTSTGKLSSRVKLYDNWKTYRKVVGAGDLNGDGIGDLVAQDKTNALYRYYGTGKGTFSSRVKLSASWGVSYNAVVGVGDITGDGAADLVARDSAGVLYRVPGTGKGSFGSRVKIATGWQGYKGLF
ncbi:FG-GAP-like repeat-containing protein [Streptomyces sp. PSKA30]|uniref:FG-GAP-like repeat-containing protein n=1 Tax=Streptomyces sp. PSKA30 TaxID=2874597 RepID=UPI001CD0E8DC|nr:FG-GAP-like repeat-containing protein [Streptomyces sp. PSKA30]MBZ9642734.1 FG-GAP-like repeat-containing protein [Streptomyces sp. PSKA30]